MTISKAFYPDTVAPNGRSTLTITLRNTNEDPLYDVNLTDNLNTMGGTDFTIASPAKRVHHLRKRRGQRNSRRAGYHAQQRHCPGAGW